MSKQREEKRFSWFLVLFLIGIGICIPKLLRPVRIEKQGYREAAKWLKENTTPKDIVAVPDTRIGFYAERKGVMYGKKVPKGAKYVVRIVRDRDEEPRIGGSMREEISLWADEQKKSRKIMLYKVL